MDVYKLRVEDTAAKTIAKDIFEGDTLCREPWYQDGSAGKRSQFAVCPACDNPIQLIGLYELPANVSNPYGKHTVSEIMGIAPVNHEARECCPYFKPRQHDKAARKERFEGTPRKILTLLIEQFDRVVYLIAKQTDVAFSLTALRGMLERYRGERGFMYTGATLRNVPWIFAYMSDATNLFGQRVASNVELSNAISELASEARIDEQGRVSTNTLPGKRRPFVDLKVSFIRHRITKGEEDAGLVESMELVVSRQQNGNLENIYQQVIEFDHSWFERLTRLRVDHQNRNWDQVNLAREVLGDLL
jgi:hypothetical protein